MESLGAYAVASNDWVTAYRFVNGLLRQGMRVLLTTEQSETVARGTFLIPLSRAFDPWFDGAVAADEIRGDAARNGVELAPIAASTRIVAAPLRLTRVGLYGGGGAPYNHASILTECGFPTRFLSDAEVRAGRLAEVDVFVMPGGGFRAMFGQIEPLGEAGCRAIADFVRQGGMYVGCCAGSYDCIVNTEAFTQACPAQGHLRLINAGPWTSASTKAIEFLDLQSPGVGVVTVRNERPDHPVMFGMPASFSLVHYNGPVLDPLPERVIEGASAAAGLARFSGWTDQFTPAECFAGPAPEERATYLEQAVDAGRFSIAAGEYGLGRVVAFGSHPEFGFDLAMVRWGQPARMFANAIFWQSMSHERIAQPMSTAPRRISLPTGAALDDVAPLASRLIDRAETLQSRSIDPPPGWLAPAYAMSVFGLSPSEIWRHALDQIIALATDATTLAGEIKTTIDERLVDPDSFDEETQLLLAEIDRWLLDERPAEWGQDGGYQGVHALLRTAIQMCDKALANWEITLGPPDGPYGHVHDNPYHLVAGSYLAAIGNIAGAVQLLRGLRAVSRQASALNMQRATVLAS